MCVCDIVCVRGVVKSVDGRPIEDVVQVVSVSVINGRPVAGFAPKTPPRVKVSPATFHLDSPLHLEKLILYYKQNKFNNFFFYIVITYQL